MKINYLFSGIDKEKGFYDVQSKYLKQDIKENQIITFIASTFDNHEQNIMYKNKTLEFFSKINITFKENYLIDNNVTKEEAKDFIKKANIIYLMGGDTYLQNNSLDEYELKPLIKEKSFIIGVSAGSLNQTKRAVYQDYDDIKDYEGLGFTNISIYPHLDFLNIDYLKEIFKISKITKLVALPNSSFIRIENNKEMFIGDYYEIENAKERKEILAQAISRGLDLPNDNYRMKLLEKRYGKDGKNDAYKKAWMMIKASGAAGISFFNKRHLQKELKQYMKDLCLLEYAPEKETEQAVLLTEWENFAKDLLDSCTGS